MTDTKSLSQQVQDLMACSSSLCECGIIHEATLRQIDEVMAYIYEEENIQINVDNGDVDPNDLNYHATNPAYMLFNYVENEEQFVEDYRNAISQSVKSDTYISDFEAAAQEIINRRN